MSDEITLEYAQQKIDEAVQAYDKAVRKFIKADDARDDAEAERDQAELLVVKALEKILPDLAGKFAASHMNWFLRGKTQTSYSTGNVYAVLENPVDEVALSVTARKRLSYKVVWFGTVVNKGSRNRTTDDYATAEEALAALIELKRSFGEDEKKARRREAVYSVMRYVSESRTISSSYWSRILDAILSDVVADIDKTADKDNWNEDDVRLAIGRVLCNKLGIEH